MQKNPNTNSPKTMTSKVLITGGNSGIGYATAKLFKKKGYDVYISGRNADKIKQAGEELGVNWLVADMADMQDVKALASHFADKGLDVLVNNAATAKLMPITSLTEDDFTVFFNTNVLGPMVLSKELIPVLESSHGCIINVSSIIVDNGVPNFTLYASTKGAIEAFSRNLALELAPKKIRVNAVSPGAIDTPIFTKIGLAPEVVAATRAQQELTIPLRRYGRPEEVAEVIVAQAESTYVTGAVWKVDGGVDAF